MEKDLKLGAAKVVHWKEIEDNLDTPIHIRVLDGLLIILAIAFVVILFKSWAFIIK